MLQPLIVSCRLQDEEERRRELEDEEVEIKREDIRRLIMEYMVGEGLLTRQVAQSRNR